MNTIQDEYQEYAFIGPAVPARTTRIEEGRVSIQWDIINRTYEEGSWYFIVFAPFNAAYAKDTTYFNTKGMNRVNDLFRKDMKIDACMLTKEINATKVHINALVHSQSDLSKLHLKHCYNRYNMFVSILPTLSDRKNVLHYILKEEQERTFTKYVDYIQWNRPSKPSQH